MLLFASRDHEGETVYKPVELTNTGALVKWPEKQRRAGGGSSQ